MAGFGYTKNESERETKKLVHLERKKKKEALDLSYLIVCQFCVYNNIVILSIWRP
jgi:hypothetical protein